MSVDEVNEKFKGWNPMEADYKNTKFNHYVSGPGADLDKELQPGHQASRKSENQNSNANQNEMPTVPTLVFKKLPREMTKNAMFNICSKHGRVKQVRDSTKNDYYFVDLATVADMEAVFRALEHNNYGFKVLVGKNKNKQHGNLERNIDNQNIAPVPPLSTGIDYQNRSYRTSNKLHPRPHIEEEPLLNSTKTVESGLPLKLLQDDIHSLERQGLFEMPRNNKFNYHNGRSYINISEKTQQFIDKKHNQSVGSYNKSSGHYIHKSEKELMPVDFDKCSVCDYACDTVCGRCSQHYCGIECQRKDWPEHRYICGKPKHLQKTPPSKKTNQPEHTKSSNVKSPELSNVKSKQSPKQQSVVSTNEDKISKSAEEKLKAPKENQTHPPSSIVSTSSTNNEDQVYKQNMPRSGNLVTITAISKINVVFIRSKTYDDNLSYFRTIDTLQAIGPMLKPLKSMPKCGQMVIAKFQDQFNRALVLNAQKPDKILANFMDYGNLDVMKLENLYEVPEEFLNKPRHAIPVLLKDVPNVYMTHEIRKFMYTYLDNISVEIRYKPEDFCEENHIFAVELIDENTQQNLNKMIIKLSKPVDPQNTNEICSRGYLEQKPLPCGDNIELIVMDNSLMCSGCVSCTTKAYAIEITKFQKELQAYAETLPNEPYTPRVDELCIARYSEDDKWYRGLCLETVGDGHPSILSIDYGNNNIVPIENIRRYPRQFTFPIYTGDCEIKGLPYDIDDKVMAKLEQLIPNGEFIKCENVTATEDCNFYVISLPDVIKQLTSCGLLNSDEHSM